VPRKEDEDVDSGWDLMEEAPAVPAPPSVPDPVSEPPSTRRATDEELRVMRARAAGSTIRLGGNRVTPKSPLRPPTRADEQKFSRPTPPAQQAIGKAPRPQPPATPPAAPPGLRISNEVVRRRAESLRRTTKVSSLATPKSEARASEPPIDLHLPDGLDFTASPLGGDVTDAGRHEAVTLPPPSPDSFAAPAVGGMRAPTQPHTPAARLKASAAAAGALDLPVADVSVSVEEGESAIEVEELVLSDEEKAALEAEAEADEAAESDPDIAAIRARMDKRDFSGAEMRAEALLEARPGLRAAQLLLDQARDALARTYLEKLGGAELVLRVAMSPSDIQGLSLDHRSGFLTSLIDGVATISEILDICGMQPLDALRLLYEMREQGVVVVDSMRP
jgi:hypothetical protein